MGPDCEHTLLTESNFDLSPLKVSQTFFEYV